MKKIKDIFSPYAYIRKFVNWQLKRSGLKFRSLETENYHITYWDTETELPPLIMIPAFAAETQYSWHKQVGALHSHFRLIIPNLIYFGGSSMKKEKSYRIKDQVQAMQELIDHLGIEKMTLCGASYGGVVAAELAIGQQENISRLVLTNCPLKYNNEKDLQAVLDAFGLHTKKELLVPDNYQQLYNLFGITYYKRPFIPKFVFKDIHKHLYRDADDRRKLVEASTSELEQLTSKAYSLTIPTLLIWGEKDLLCPVYVGEQLKAHFGSTTALKVIPRTAHLPNYEKPRMYNKILLRFLKEG
ncbi:MAG: alpha/beta hydrolase [Crocinitomicaceae bacterium]